MLRKFFFFISHTKAPQMWKPHQKEFLPFFCRSAQQHFEAFTFFSPLQLDEIKPSDKCFKFLPPPFDWNYFLSLLLILDRLSPSSDIIVKVTCGLFPSTRCLVVITWRSLLMELKICYANQWIFARRKKRERELKANGTWKDAFWVQLFRLADKNFLLHFFRPSNLSSDWLWPRILLLLKNFPLSYHPLQCLSPEKTKIEDYPLASCRHIFLSLFSPQLLF